MADRFALYQTSIHYTDTLVGQVLDDLDRRGLAEETVVIVTADHGEEFQESGPEYRIHGSGFSRYQLQVPLLVAWPGREAIHASYRTSHYDIAPTLLGDLAGCAFASRCPLVEERCRRETPALREQGPGRRAACHLVEEVAVSVPDR